MAENESGQNRTIDPSPKRLEDARKEGHVPRSRDLAHLFVIGAAVTAMALVGSSLGQASRDMLARGMRFDAAAATEPGKMAARPGALSLDALIAVAPVLLIMLVASVAAPLLLGGWLFAPGVIVPRLER